MKKNTFKIGIQLIVVAVLLVPMQMNIGKVQAQADPALEALEEITPENIKDLELLRWIGEGAYTGAIAQQTNGNLIAAATTAGVKLLDKGSGEQIGFIPIGLEPTTLAISPDDSTLAVVVNLPTGDLGGFMGLPEYEQEIQFYSLPSGEKKGEAIRDLGECMDSNILALAFSSDGSELVFEKKYGIQNDEKKFCVLSIHEGKVFRSKDVPKNTEMEISPKGDFAATVTSQSDTKGSKISIYSTADFSLVTELETTQTGYYDLSFSQNGQYVGLTSYEENGDQTIYTFQVWNLEDGKLIFSGSPSTEEDIVQAFDVDASGDTVILGTQFGYVEIYTAHAGKMEKQLGPFTWTSYSLTGNSGGVTDSDQPAPIKNVLLSQDGKMLTISDYLTTYGQSSHVRIIEMPGGKELSDFQGPSSGSENLEIAFSPDSSQIALVGLPDGKVEIYDVKDGELVFTLNGHTQVVNQAIFSPDGKIIATGSNDNTIRLWDAKTGKIIRILEGHQGRVNRMAFSPDGTWLVSGADDNTLRRWNVSDGKLLETLDLGNENWRVEFLDILMENTSVVYRITKYPSPYIGYITKQMIWNTQSGESQSIGGSNIYISGLSADRDLFMGFSTDRVIGTFQEDGSMKVISTFQSPYGNGALTYLALSPNKRLVISGNGFGLHAWELADNKLNFLGLTAAKEPVPSYGNDYLFSPDGKYLAYTSGGVAYLMGVEEK
ncbi:MAG: WD40 repeat domain-containing protein [Anaerolineaceae bacterium]